MVKRIKVNPSLSDSTRLQIISDSASYWIDFLGIGQTWSIDFQLVDEIDHTAEGGHDACADTRVSLPYPYAQIRFKRGFIDDNPDGLEPVVLHELLHIFISDLSNQIDDLSRSASMQISPSIERVVSSITRIMLRLRYPKRVMPFTLSRG